MLEMLNMHMSVFVFVCLFYAGDAAYDLCMYAYVYDLVYVYVYALFAYH
jgi:hypothetical protein